ncbi:hypothetical protein [Solihabitans fulvus]|nr:hypothetical protein [Solihabitans fulvus]
MQQERAALDIEVLGPPVALAADGEVIGAGNRFRFTAREGALRVYRPNA